jgi:cytochrome c peroxidase
MDGRSDRWLAGARVGVLVLPLVAVVAATIAGLRAHNVHAATASAAASTSTSTSTSISDAPDARAAIGRRAFFDPDLSTPPGTACSSCHDPARGYAGDNGSSRGVPRGSRSDHFARRATPSLLYLRFVRRFHFRWDDDADNPEAFGGFFWDGRADSIATLVRQPLLNPDEMGNADDGALRARLEASAYADDLRGEFDGVFDTPERAVEALGQCLEAFLTSPAMSPFSSRYDDFVRGSGDLTPLEKRGLALFKDHTKGACASCHSLDDRSPVPARSLFTDFGYEVLAVPRNRAASPDDARVRDLGLCQRPDRKWHSDDDRFCGAFRTPSLRNVALRPAFMHNGVFSRLRDVVAFYATRSTSPERWYPGGGDYDDLPKKYWTFVNNNPAPYNRRRGETPTLDESDIGALVAFLETLTDRDIPR